MKKQKKKIEIIINEDVGLDELITYMENLVGFFKSLYKENRSLKAHELKKLYKKYIETDKP